MPEKQNTRDRVRWRRPSDDAARAATPLDQTFDETTRANDDDTEFRGDIPVYICETGGENRSSRNAGIALIQI